MAQRKKGTLKGDQVWSGRRWHTAPVGTKRSDGKVYSGRNYGFQSQTSHNKLKDKGQLKGGTQQLDNVVKAINKKVPAKVKNAVKGYQQWYEKGSARQRENNKKSGVGRALNAWNDTKASVSKAVQKPVNKVTKAISNKLNVDERIVKGAGATALAIGSRKIGGKLGPAIKAASKKGVKPSVRRSVGAAARPQTNASMTIKGPKKTGVVAKKKPTTTKKKTTSTIKSTQAARSPEDRRKLRSKVTTERSGKGKVTEAGKKLAEDSAKNSKKNFTPARRAKAVERANSRPAKRDDKVIGKKAHHGKVTRTNKAIGYETEANWRHNPAGGRGKEYDIAIKDTKSAGYNKREGTKLSKSKAKLKSAGAKDLVGKSFGDVKAYDKVKGLYEPGKGWTAPKSLNTKQARARDRLIGEKMTGGVLKSKPIGRSGERRFSATKYKDGTYKNIEGKRKTLPDTSKDLKKLTKSKSTRVGKAAGGTSKSRIKKTKTKSKKRKLTIN